ncbi:MAG: hypothetical protein L3K15_05645 [Thermoplasmata archaeon]|nr:hypothetical protein [Thermoplasmata archaeon]
MPVREPTELVLPPTAQVELRRIRTVLLRSGVILVGLGVLCMFLLLTRWGQTSAPGTAGLLGGALLLASVGGWCLGMSTSTWMMGRAVWGSRFFPGKGAEKPPTRPL